MRCLEELSPWDDPFWTLGPILTLLDSGAQKSIIGRLEFEKIRPSVPPGDIASIHTKVVFANGRALWSLEEVTLRVRSPRWHASRPGVDYVDILFLIVDVKGVDAVIGWDHMRSSPMVMGSLLDCASAQGGLQGGGSP